MSQFHILGLDLGQSQDYSALSLLEVEPKQHQRPIGRDRETGLPTDETETVDGMPLTFRCRYLSRFPLNTAYADIVKGVGQVMGRFRSKPVLATDATGVGRGVVEMLHLAGLEPTPIEITAGSTVSVMQGIIRVPKKDLIATMLTAFEQERLKFGADIKILPVLLKELQNFKAKITPAANVVYEAARESDHDDLVLSIALAAWLAEQLVTASLTEPHSLVEPVTISNW